MMLQLYVAMFLQKINVYQNLITIFWHILALSLCALSAPFPCFIPSDIVLKSFKINNLRN